MLNCHLQSRVAVLVLADRNLGPSTGNDRRWSHWVLLGCICDSTEQRERQTDCVKLSHRTPHTSGISILASWPPTVYTRPPSLGPFRSFRSFRFVRFVRSCRSFLPFRATPAPQGQLRLLRVRNNSEFPYFKRFLTHLSIPPSFDLFTCPQPRPIR